MSTSDAQPLTKKDLMGRLLYTQLLSILANGVAIVVDGETRYRQPNGAELNAILRYYENIDEVQAAKERPTEAEILENMAKANFYDPKTETFKLPTDPSKVAFNPVTGGWDQVPAGGVG